MFSALKTAIRGMVKSILLALVPELYFVFVNDPKKVLWSELLNQSIQSNVSETCRLYAPYHLDQTAIGDYTYIARNAWISMTRIGKFCSIGRNLVCGQGRHPTNGISTSPYFYSDR